MGWLYPYHTHTRKDLIKDLIKPEEGTNGKWETLRHCVRGSILWTRNRYTNKTTGEVSYHVVCHIMSKHGTWGYKSISYDAHPYYYHCPKSYLEGLDPQDGYAADWCSKVHEYWASRRKAA